MATGGRELFPADLGLQVRMVIALLLGALFTAALLGAVVWLAVSVEDGWQPALFIVVIAAAGFVTSREAADRMRYRASFDPDKHDLAGFTREEAVRNVEGHLVRLATLADVPLPRADLFWADAPLCWTTVGLTGRPRVHVTTTLVQRLSDDQLAAVLAHELTHIANGDARVMTFVAGPASWLVAGLRDMYEEGGRAMYAAIGLALLLLPVLLPAALTGRIASRHRELAADRGGALLTGSPSALASALLELSGRLDRIPRRDLRVAGAGDLFYVLPTREAHGIRRLWATHPPLGRRVVQLERMEQALHRARPVL
ncbi:MAG TPA: M48 family metalloprotease [Thermoleophilaceae bacterium]